MKKTNNKGGLLIQTLVLSGVSLLLMFGMANWTRTNIKASREALLREQAIEIAEAGIEYYRWHLAHNKTDYTDGTGAPGPYIHEVKDRDGNVIGLYSLTITPPLIGSTRVRVESTGTPASTTISRTIKVEMAIPSLAKYAVAGNDFMRFGEGTEVFGPIHSNNGVRFDGLAHNLVTSAVATYDDPDHDESGADKFEFGVHTHLNPPPSSGSSSAWRPLEAPPTNPVPARSDVFEAGRQFPVPAVDFVGITSDLANIKTQAQNSGRYFAPSGRQGYQIILKTNDTFDVHRVNSQMNPPSQCDDGTSEENGWGTWSINTKNLVGNYPIPANGLIFVEDNVWVQGQVDTARATIAAGRFPDNPSNRPQININTNLTYSNYNGSDVLALISQGNLNVGLYSDNNFRIDAALVSQNGRVGRYYYESQCGTNYTRNTLTLFGMIASNKRYGFSYTDGTGYQNRNIIYDANLLYGPPPSFPLTSDQYEILSWEEI